MKKMLDEITNQYKNSKKTSKMEVSECTAK
jgi:hypothetical protein